MEPFIAKYQPKNLELWKSGKDIQPHPDDSKEIKEVWKFCNEILEKSVDEISVNKLGEDIKMFEISKTATKDESKTEEPTELTEEEKVQILKKYCRKQCRVDTWHVCIIRMATLWGEGNTVLW